MPRGESSVTNKILIVPKGHFGDMLLTTPVFEALKRSSPDNHITVLAPPQTADLARRDPFVDEVIVFDRRKEYPGLKGVRAFVSLLRSKGFNRSYAFHRSPRTSVMLRLAGIPERVGYGDALLSFFSNRTVLRLNGCTR